MTDTASTNVNENQWLENQKGIFNGRARVRDTRAQVRTSVRGTTRTARPSRRPRALCCGR